MRHNDAQESLADGIDLAPLPPMGADGQPQLAPAQPLPLEPPRLCEAGPCRHYHTFKIQLDAQNPMDSGAHGHVFHTERHHYCYPNTGVETNLGSLPVLECNRWVPTFRLLRTRGMVKRRYERELNAFARAQVTTVGEIDLGDGPFVLEIHVVGADGQEHDVSVEPLPDAALADIVPAALVQAKLPITSEFALCDADGASIDNLSATPAQLGLPSGARLIVNLSPKDPEK